MDPLSLNSAVFIAQFFDFLTSIAGMLFALTILWMIFRRSRRHSALEALATDEKKVIEDVMRTADRMDQRLTTLEKILDAEDSKWRDRAA